MNMLRNGEMRSLAIRRPCSKGVGVVRWRSAPDGRQVKGKRRGSTTSHLSMLYGRFERYRLNDNSNMRKQSTNERLLKCV